MDYDSIFTECASLLHKENTILHNLKALCDYLHKAIPHYDWFGFYIAKKDKHELVLGPYCGESTDHVSIPFGKGICGQAAETQKTFLVSDVSKEENYLACSIKVKSEIVVPIFTPNSKQEKKIIGEIDIDSHTINAFTKDDETFLQKLSILVAENIASIQQ